MPGNVCTWVCKTDDGDGGSDGDGDDDGDDGDDEMMMEMVAKSANKCA